MTLLVALIDADGGVVIAADGEESSLDGETFGAVLGLHVNEPGNFHAAGIAPGSPEIQQNDFAFVIGELDRGAIGISEAKIRSGFPAVVRR